MQKGTDPLSTARGTETDVPFNISSRRQTTSELSRHLFAIPSMVRERLGIKDGAQSKFVDEASKGENCWLVFYFGVS